MDSWGEQGMGKVAEVMGRWSVAGMKQASWEVEGGVNEGFDWVGSIKRVVGLGGFGLRCVSGSGWIIGFGLKTTRVQLVLILSQGPIV